jgi:rubrerythrin
MSPQIDPTEQVLEALQEALKAEWTAVHQYLLHSKMCKNWGYDRLADSNRKESLDELGHAEALMDRTLFLTSTWTTSKASCTSSARSASAASWRGSSRASRREKWKWGAAPSARGAPS